MITKAVFALFFPFMLVVLFTRVTFNHYVAIALTAALLFASYLKGYTETYFIVGLDVVSLVAGGLYMAKKAAEKKKNKSDIMNIKTEYLLLRFKSRFLYTKTAGNKKPPNFSSYF